jgi:hypothetical protein
MYLKGYNAVGTFQRNLPNATQPDTKVTPLRTVTNDTYPR